MNFLQGGGLGGGGGGGQTSSAKSTSQTIFGGQNTTNQLHTLVPWIVGGAAFVAIAIAAVLIAALKR